MAPTIAKSFGSPARSVGNRAAWLYLNRGLTQQDVAAQLGISRASVIRLINEARASGDVQVMLQTGKQNDIPLALDLEERFGLDEAIVVPTSPRPEVTIGRALGEFLSQVVASEMMIGVGWGRTLDAALDSFVPAQAQNVTVCSLVGGIVELNTRNPVEFAWRFAEAANARCMLMLSPLIVDQSETRRRLMEETDLASLFSKANCLDLAVMGCGETTAGGNSTIMQHLPPSTQTRIRQDGGVADVLCQFLTLSGEKVSYPEADRVMAADLSSIARAKAVVLAGGGPKRGPALVAACRRFKNVTLVTDRSTAQSMLKVQSASKA